VCACAADAQINILHVVPVSNATTNATDTIWAGRYSSMELSAAIVGRSSAHGELLWSVVVSTLDAYDYAVTSLAAGPDGSIVLCGTLVKTYSVPVLGDVISLVSNGGVVAKLSPIGEMLWSQSLPISMRRSSETLSAVVLANGDILSGTCGSVACFVFIPYKIPFRDTTKTLVCFYLYVTWTVEQSYVVGWVVFAQRTIQQRRLHLTASVLLDHTSRCVHKRTYAIGVAIACVVCVWVPA
jgi:hypothetical protein